MSWGHFDFSRKPCPITHRLSRERDAKARAKKQERLENLRCKYHDMPLNWAVIQLFWQEGNLTIPDIAKILETDEDTIRFEIDIARQNAQ